MRIDAIAEQIWTLCDSTKGSLAGKIYRMTSGRNAVGRSAVRPTRPYLPSPPSADSRRVVGSATPYPSSLIRTDLSYRSDRPVQTYPRSSSTRPAGRWRIFCAALVSVLVLVGVSTVLVVRVNEPPGSAWTGQVALTSRCIVGTGVDERDYQSFPYVASTADGSIFAVWRAAAGHQAALSTLLVSRLRQPSSGCAWSQPHAIAVETDPRYTLSVGGVTQNARGDLIVPVVRYRVLSVTRARDFRAYVTSSADGSSWTPLRSVDGGFTGQSYPSSVIKLAGGTLLMSLYGNDDPTTYTGWHVRFAVSMDGGRTWSPRGEGIKATAGREWTEPSLLASEGKLLVAVRSDAKVPTDTPGSFVSESFDGGIHWSVPRRMLNDTSGHPALFRLSDGRYVLPYRDATTPTGSFRYATSPDLINWQPGQDVTEGSTRRMLYAGVADAGSGRSIMVYALENSKGDPEGSADVYSTLI
ncbi:MAG: exo-alpha-sialidase [Pseudonocardiaceae bacterium]